MHQLVIQFPLSTTNPNGSDFDALISLEETLERFAEDKFEVDGHDAGAGEMNIFIITDDAVKTFALIEGSLPSDRPWRAGFRDLDADDYIPIAPPDLTTFEVQ